MPSPAVSVVLPTYNREMFLREAISSVLDQTMRGWELVVVDDGSADGTVDFLRKLSDPRLQVIAQENAGVAAARNRGVATSSAPLIAFLDSDDLWLPRKLEAQLAFFERHPDISICQTEELWVRRGRRVNPARRHRKHSGWIFRECLPRCIVSPSAVMLRRGAFEAMGGFDPAFPVCEDYDLWLRASLRYEIHTLPEPLIVKCGGHADQLSAQWGQDRWRVRALEKILADPMLSDELRPLVHADIVRRARIVANGARQRGNALLAQEFDERAHRAIE